jgi:hypothetical protein
MAGLPGWDRDRLALAPGADVEAARWQIYAGKVEPQINTDYPGLIHKLELSEMPTKTREREEKAQLRRDKETLRAGERRQADLRAALLLDEEDEPDEVDA